VLQVSAISTRISTKRQIFLQILLNNAWLLNSAMESRCVASHHVQERQQRLRRTAKVLEVVAVVVLVLAALNLVLLV
jgi:hypothetical protein